LRGPREHDHGHSDRLGQSEPGVDGGDAGDESERDDPEQQRRHVSDAGPDVTVKGELPSRRSPSTVTSG